MFPQYIELKQDHNLINSNFEGYKLFPDEVSLEKIKLLSPPFRASASPDQYSFLHAELFTLHNHLVSDPWNPGSSYFVDTNGFVQKVSFADRFGEVHKLDWLKGTNSVKYNVSFHFISEKLCVLCDGCNNAFIIDTGDRETCTEWHEIFKFCVSSDLTGFVLRDARLDISNSEKVVTCLFLHIALENKNFCSKILICNVRQQDSQWINQLYDTLSGKGSLHFCELGENSNSLVISSDKGFVFDSSKVDNVPDTETAQSFSWHQTDEDILINLPSRGSKDVKDYKIICTEKSCKVKYQQEIVLEGELFDKIDPQTVTWTLENNFVQIIIEKKNSINWPHLFPNEPKESVEINSRSLPQMNLKPVANLEDQNEDCDLSNFIDESYFIEYINLQSKICINKINLGSFRLLFTTIVRAGFPRAIVTRQDVDGCVWIQQYDPENCNKWSLKHERNLHAFGYVQASKSQKKFMNCSPDFRYMVICESHRHVFFYKLGNKQNDNSHIPIGKQHLITLNDSGEVLGMTVANNVTTLLTENDIICIKIN